MSHYRVTLVKKSRAGTEVLKTFHKSNPRVEPGMVQAIARDHGKFVTIRVCFLDDAECPAFTIGGKDGQETGTPQNSGALHSSESLQKPLPIPAIPQGEA